MLLFQKTSPSVSIPLQSVLPGVVQILGLRPGKTASLSSCTCAAFHSPVLFHFADGLMDDVFQNTQTSL